MTRRTPQAQTLQPPDLDEAERFGLPAGGMLRTDGHYEEVVLNDCDLRLARLTSARLAGADLRGSNLEGIEAGPGDLHGAIIEPMQAADLIALLGVTLRNRGDRP